VQAAAGAFPALVVLDLSNLLLSGPLPDSWAAAPAAFPALRFLALHGNTLGDAAAPGPLPPEWTKPGSLASLQASAVLAFAACSRQLLVHAASCSTSRGNMAPLPPCSCAAVQSLVLFPGNHAVCTPGQPGNYTTVTGAASGSSGSRSGSSGYRVLDVFFTTLNTAYMACYL
jgi:hypothetical protein